MPLVTTIVTKVSHRAAVNVTHAVSSTISGARPNISDNIFRVAVAAGVATLNPLIGLAVYGVELLSGDVQNKLASVVYDITGTLNKPIVTKTDIQENIVHNIHSTINME